jgi:hypothetical protein
VSNLFAELYLDEDVSMLVAELLRARLRRTDDAILNHTTADEMEDQVIYI